MPDTVQSRQPGWQEQRRNHPAITARWIKFFLEFRYFVWPAWSIFTYKSVTRGCSFPLTMKPCKIKKQSAVRFLTLFPISEPGLSRPKQKARLSLKLALGEQGASQGWEHYLKSLSKALAALSQTRAAASALPLGRMIMSYLWPAYGRVQTTTWNFFKVTVLSLKSLWFCLWI